MWDDIETLDEEQQHYMGYIVLQRKGTHDFEVVDGQQRLVTLSFSYFSWNETNTIIDGKGN